MMSDYESEIVSNIYETAVSSAPPEYTPAVPASNVPVQSYFKHVSPQPPMYKGPPATQTWSDPTVAPQSQQSAIMPQNMDPSVPFFQTFLKGQPKALGILLIVAAILEIALGIALAFLILSYTLLSGIPFWGPVFYIIAGSLTLAAQTKPNICFLKGSLSLNIISSLFSMVAVILNCIDLAILQCYLYSYFYQGYYFDDYEGLSLCQQKLVFVIQNDAGRAVNPGAFPVPVTNTYTQPPPVPPPTYPFNVFKA
ncbi:uncharacterized protein [Aquarana catesbeiana]|uniref:uncharacterized protein isoform X2 n=1 Tax=Aquarana catesbeiana TaxID=8400 RepID=UPI003CC929F4